MTKIKLENGRSIEMKPGTEITCQTHGVAVTWGSLNPIQQVAVKEGIDTIDELPCIMTKRGKNNGSAEGAK